LSAREGGISLNLPMETGFRPIKFSAGGLIRARSNA
jgi:hypothetical protein